MYYVKGSELNKNLFKNKKSFPPIILSSQHKSCASLNCCSSGVKGNNTLALKAFIFSNKMLHAFLQHGDF